MSSAIELTREFTKTHMARAVPGAFFDRESKAWVLADPTPRGAAVALRLFPDLSREHPDLIDLRDSLLQDVRPFDNATPAGLDVDVPMVERALAAEDKALYEFQRIDLGYLGAVLRQHRGGYLGWERGLGKTLGTCALAEDLEVQTMLVVAPNTAKEPVWKAELERWLGEYFDFILVLPNAKAKREGMLRWVKKLRREGKRIVLVVHYESLAIVGGRTGKKAIARGWDQYGTWDLLVADEAHRIWNTDALMTKAVKKVPSTMRLALSGSIIQNHAEELFSPLQWLFPKTYRSKWRDWNDRFLDYVDGGYGRICVGIKPERLDEMRKELGVFMVYRRKEDELDLPDKTEQTLMVDLSSAQRKAYDELVTTAMTQLEDGTSVKAADGLVMLTRLRQIATGLDLLGHEVTDSTKLELALDMISDSDEAFVVFSWYKAAARSLQERLCAKSIDSFLVDGDVPHERRADYIERFQAGEGRVFIGTLSTLSESVTLHRASNAIFLDRSWNPATNVQAADRIYRIGQDKPVTITHIVARDTVDELNVLPALASKESLRRTILGGI